MVPSNGQYLWTPMLSSEIHQTAESLRQPLASTPNSSGSKNVTSCTPQLELEKKASVGVPFYETAVHTSVGCVSSGVSFDNLVRSNLIRAAPARHSIRIQNRSSSGSIVPGNNNAKRHFFPASRKLQHLPVRRRIKSSVLMKARRCL